MTTYKFGDVLLVSFPFTDQTTTKKRPTIVISSEIYNQSKLDILLIAVTSQVKMPLQFGEILITDWSNAGLLKPSLIKPIITTLEKQLVIKKLGKLETTDSQALQGLLQQIIAIT
ncbi:type II toxin-antitoxin system PemK/MazF family toxin [Pseudanabaena mucicola]|uniref:Type II toxin-antitoxin system PemK/MazF family toxin n=1 Tax=Pseudanabaena mucicola FACHB-723 TaxID=2692860 RepID=A0ABR7ZYY8_9CYAN|nr:type II toxin-antitoxin system PemK/MazF family toxin [Pseudanabaena mucicola]MBD2188292.1 type II toxin-antitoxin system PemK/MazF family toxin [Pseudanabaena mucicola FACHB-723]